LYYFKNTVLRTKIFISNYNIPQIYLCRGTLYFRDILYKRKLMKLFPVMECLKLCSYSQPSTLHNSLALRVTQRFPWQRKWMLPEWRHSHSKDKRTDIKHRPSLTKYFLCAFPNSFHNIRLIWVSLLCLNIVDKFAATDDTENWCFILLTKRLTPSLYLIWPLLSFVILLKFVSKRKRLYRCTKLTISIDFALHFQHVQLSPWLRQFLFEISRWLFIHV
jgi:hypothetical protein